MTTFDIVVRVWLHDGCIREYGFSQNEYNMAERCYSLFDKLRGKQLMNCAVEDRTINYVELTIP